MQSLVAAHDNVTFQVAGVRMAVDQYRLQLAQLCSELELIVKGQGRSERSHLDRARTQELPG